MNYYSPTHEFSWDLDTCPLVALAGRSILVFVASLSSKSDCTNTCTVLYTEPSNEAPSQRRTPLSDRDVVHECNDINSPWSQPRWWNAREPAMLLFCLCNQSICAVNSGARSRCCSIGEHAGYPQAPSRLHKTFAMSRERNSGAGRGPD